MWVELIGVFIDPHSLGLEVGTRKKLASHAPSSIKAMEEFS